MANIKVNDTVELLLGVDVVGRGMVMHVDPTVNLHGFPLPKGHIGVSVTHVYDPNMEIPYPPPHEPDVNTLGSTIGYIIAWSRFAIAAILSRCSSGSTSCRSLSSTSSAGSRGSKYSRMSNEDFEAEAKARGYERRDRPRDNEVNSSKGLNCFNNCFSSSSKKKIGSTLQMIEEQNTTPDPPILTQASPMLAATSTIVIPTPMPAPIQSRPPNVPNQSLAQDKVPLASTVQQTKIEASNRNLYYKVDGNGDVCSNARGKCVYTCMHELMYVYFLDDIFTDWRRQPRQSKEAVLMTLHREFPNPSHLRFKDKPMLQHMGHVLKTRRGHARKAARLGTLKPSFLSHQDWKKVKDELRQFPNRWDQQKLAARVQRETTGFNRFGSGGKAHFRAYFKRWLEGLLLKKSIRRHEIMVPQIFYTALKARGCCTSSSIRRPD